MACQNCKTFCESSASRAHSQPGVESWIVDSISPLHRLHWKCSFPSFESAEIGVKLQFSRDNSLFVLRSYFFWIGCITSVFGGSWPHGVVVEWFGRRDAVCRAILMQIWGGHWYLTLRSKSICAIFPARRHKRISKSLRCLWNCRTSWLASTAKR